MMVGPEKTEAFVTCAMRAQRSLHAYILTLVADLTEADDVLQETNLVIWRKRDDFQEGTDFLAWAFRIAYYQVLAYRKTRQRDRLRFDLEIVEKLAEETFEQAEALEEKLRALAGCLEQLSRRDRELLQLRYAQNLSADKISQEVGRSVGAVYQVLYRIRNSLGSCVEKVLAGGKAGA